MVYVELFVQNKVCIINAVYPHHHGELPAIGWRTNVLLILLPLDSEVKNQCLVVQFTKNVFKSSVDLRNEVLQKVFPYSI